MAIAPQTDPSKFLSGQKLDSLIKKLKEKLLRDIASGKADQRDIIYPAFTSARTPSGQLARVRQKILIIEEKGKVKAKLANGDTVKVNFADSPPEDFTNAYIKRISEYPNYLSEFDQPSYTILLAWDNNDGPNFIHSPIDSLEKEGTLVSVLAQADQSDNFIINGDPPKSQPSPPIAAENPYGTAGSALSDYSDETYDIIDNANPGPVSGSQYIKNKIKVVVSDTGLKFNLQNPPNQEYKTNNGSVTSFPIAPNLKVGDANKIGFCSVTEYLYENSYNPSLPLPKANGQVDTKKVLQNPTDDNVGRHGTHVTGIITHNQIGDAEVIPLKIFDFQGHGTLFDILCGFNYVFSRLDTGENIRIVNASWAGHVSVHNRSLFNLLEKKVRVLKEKNVFLIASAGNRNNSHDKIGTDISVEQRIPACYSAEYDNVITVTSVVEKWDGHRLLRGRAANFWKGLLQVLFGLVPSSYLPVENFSATYVQVGVVTLAGFLPSPFQGSPPRTIEGSSFAAAYMSAYVVRFLENDPNATREKILDSLKDHPGLYPYIQKGRYLELGDWTGKSVEENFMSMIDEEPAPA